MPSVLVDIPEQDLREIEKVAKENFRSRKAQMELILNQWIEKESAKK